MSTIGSVRVIEQNEMPGSPTPLRRVGFRRLSGAQAVSSIGDWLATFALMTLVLDISGSAAAVGGVLALRLAPATVAGPLIGFVASRWGRRALLVRLDLTRAGVVLLIPLIRSLWWVFPLTVVLEIAAVIAIAARDASIRDLVDEPDLPLANGIVLGATYGAIPLGAGAFTLVTTVFEGASGVLGGPHAAFWLDAVTFVVSASLIRRISEIPARPEPTLTAGGRVRLSAAFRIPLVGSTLPPIVAASLGIGTLFSLGVGFVRDTLGASDAQFGTLVVLFGVGAAAGLALRQFGPFGGLAAVRLGVGAMGGVMAVMAFASGLGTTFLMAVAFGLGGAFAIVSGLTVLQSELASERQLLALGAFHVTVRVALAVGALAAGGAVDIFGDRPVLGLEPIRLVLVVAGALTAASAVRVSRESGHPGR